MHTLHLKLNPCTSGKQVFGVVAWVMSVVLEAARAEQYGVLILKDGPPCTPTAIRQNNQTASRVASKYVIGTKTCMTGNSVPGINVSQCQCEVPGCSALLYAPGERRAFRPVK
ncbi:hypothetical protein Q5P01_017889 [Channa striata]|uniref:Uncharacterized protein n=1 Tax=Channa striata TaxID=64152 RepID=A0AA88SDH9_CHASR|nr:hypothetical protein Q5P01_017889 [Channa striata]